MCDALIHVGGPLQAEDATFDIRHSKGLDYTDITQTGRVVLGSWGLPKFVRELIEITLTR